MLASWATAWIILEAQLNVHSRWATGQVLILIPVPMTAMGGGYVRFAHYMLYLFNNIFLIYTGTYLLLLIHVVFAMV